MSTVNQNTSVVNGELEYERGQKYFLFPYCNKITTRMYDHVSFKSTCFQKNMSHVLKLVPRFKKGRRQPSLSFSIEHQQNRFLST